MTKDSFRAWGAAALTLDIHMEPAPLPAREQNLLKNNFENYFLKVIHTLFAQAIVYVCH